MGRHVAAVRPFWYNETNSNFKQPLYEEWVKAGGKGIDGRQGKGRIRSALYHIDLPTIYKGKEVRLCFVEGVSIRFDTFPDHLFHEVIPVIWDCWPKHIRLVATWFRRHGVKTAIFTSSQIADRMRVLFPQMNILTITEGIETWLYTGGGTLEVREYDYLEFGRCCRVISSNKLSKNIRVLSSRYHWIQSLQTREQLIRAQESSKVTIALTRHDTQPKETEGIDTLTQRYWECMLSRTLMVGRAPKELIGLIGYDPVVPIYWKNPIEQIEEIIQHIGDYQQLVDRNREAALKYGDWSLRAQDIRQWLEECGYRV